LFGSIERFIGILIEHYAGAFPTWLSPVQVKVIPVNPEIHKEYAAKVLGALLDKDLRAEADNRDEKLGYRIREAQTKKIPYQLVLGDKEASEGLVTFRRYGKEESRTVSLDDFIQMIQKEIASK